MPKFQKYLRHIDLLVTPYEFNVNKSQKSLTKLGGFFSIAILILMIIYTISIFISTISKQVSIYTGTQTQSDIEYLDQNSSLFILQLSHSESGEIITYDSELIQYFSLNIQHVHQVRPENTTKYYRNTSKLNLINCSQEMIHQFNFYKNYPTQEQASKFLCFKGNYNLTGSFFDPVYDYVKISVEKCQNQTNCKNNEELETFIEEGINVNLFLLDSKIKQTLNLTEPSQESAYVIFWRLTTGIANNEDIFLQPIIIDLIASKNVFSSLSGNDDTRKNIFSSSRIEKSERRQYPIDLITDTNLCTFYLRTSNDSQYFFAQKTETFSILLDAISQASGLAVAILGLAKILYKIYIEHETYIKVMNQVYKFDLRDSQAIKDTINQTCNYTNEKEQRIDQIYETQLSYSFFTYFQIKASKIFKSLYIFGCCCKSNYEKKVMMAQMAKSKIMSDLELSNIVKKLYEIDCLKLLLFDDDQLKLFNSFAQPVFQKNIVEQKELLKQINKDFNRQQMKKSVLDRYQLTNLNSGPVGVEEIFQSSIPIEMQLSKLSRFFKAQIKAQNGEELLQVYSKILSGRNSNSNMNEQLLNFIKYNSNLYQIIDASHKKISIDFQENQITPKITKARSQYSKFRQSQDLDLCLVINEGKESAEDGFSISDLSPPCIGQISKNNGDQEVESKDFDEIQEKENETKKSQKINNQQF